MPFRLSLVFCCLFALAQLSDAAEARRRAGQQTGRNHLRVQYRSNQPSQRLRKSPDEFRETFAAGVDTLNILAIRVEFRADTSDRTTGDGRFLRAADAKYTIDPPPHNRSYFAAQLTALANYYRSVSHGKLILQFQIYPEAEDQAYALERPMDYYGPGAESPVRDQRLAELFRDGFTRADAQDAINFSRFDAFILFHAGIGEDFNEDFDPTPNDIASAFLALNDLRKELGNNDPNYQGIPVQNGAFFIPEGIILPEMQSREIGTQGLVEFGLLGTSTLMFGYQLGLPNLFNTDTGGSGIGQFGLMDQGSNNYQGLLPAQPSAWEKFFLGWEEPIVVTQGENLEVAAALHQNPNRIYKIPITDTEYFLLENRQRDVNGDRLAIGRDVNGVRIEFKESSFLAGSPFGVITTVDEYDFGLPYAIDNNGRALPGAGILIWHIDEEVIRAKYASNQVNSDADRRGVDLEEADGAQDIGKFYGFLSPGSGSELGLPEDAWWKSNPIITEFLRPNQEVTFGPTTIPSTASNDGVNSGIVITNFSEIAPVMTFSLRNQFAVPNFPQFAGGKANVLSPMLGDVSGDGQSDIIVATSIGEIFAWQFSGEKLIANSDSATITQPNGKQTRIPAARFAALGDSLFSPPVLADLNGDGRPK
jgi:M6 family metalloprotease-like protein